MPSITCHTDLKRQAVSYVFKRFDDIVGEDMSDGVAQEADLLSVKKGTKLLETGQRNNYRYMIIKGCVRIYHTEPNGTENSFWYSSRKISLFHF